MKIFKTRNKDTYRYLNKALLNGSVKLSGKPRGLNKLERDGSISFDKSTRILKRDKLFKVYLR